MIKCDHCGGEIIGGKVHEMKSTNVSTHVTTIFHHCEMCAEEIAWGFWDEETQGPFPRRLHAKGHA